MDPRQLAINDFTYPLPPERIASYPLPDRDASKLLVYRNGQLTETHYRQLPDQLPAGSLLVFNDTRVVEARLRFQKPTGGIVEVFCLEPHEKYPDITAAMAQTQSVWWKCLVGGASKWKPGQLLNKIVYPGESEVQLQARYLEKRSDHFITELSWTPAQLSFADVLHLAGTTPLPPYLHREAEPADAERYQTIFAREEGSVAAPTAGLHFTDQLMRKLAEHPVRSEYVTLHVGAGTFKPVKSATMNEHEMHAEFIEVSRSAILTIRDNLNRTIVAVGTTSLRTLESLYWIGTQLANNPAPAGLPELGQWEPYESGKLQPTAAEALDQLLQWMEKRKLEKLVAKTRIIIAPGYRFRVAGGLITNFHQPQSTLLLLVAALVGPDWRKIYEYALEHDFRFLSYGDGCLLWPDS